MGVATAKWAGHECWSADGLLLPADVFVPLHGSPQVGYRAGGLVWVLHLSDSEAFTAVSVEGGEVVAVAEEYPFRNEFRIPIAEPGRLRVRSEGVAGPPRGG